MLRQFRAVDDSVTLRLNREFAHSRDRGTSVPPSLLMQHSKSFSSSTATDVGRSTYSSVSEPMCATIWRDLVDLWMRREDTIKYCMEVNAQHAQQAQAAQAPRNKDDMLDLDRVQAQSALTAEIPRSRGESMGEFMVRAMALMAGTPVPQRARRRVDCAAAFSRRWVPKTDTQCSNPAAKCSSPTLMLASASVRIGIRASRQTAGTPM